MWSLVWYPYNVFLNKSSKSALHLQFWYLQFKIKTSNYSLIWTINSYLQSVVQILLPKMLQKWFIATKTDMSELFRPQMALLSGKPSKAITLVLFPGHYFVILIPQRFIHNHLLQFQFWQCMTSQQIRTVYQSKANWAACAMIRIINDSSVSVPDMDMNTRKNLLVKWHIWGMLWTVCWRDDVC